VKGGSQRVRTHTPHVASVARGSVARERASPEMREETPAEFNHNTHVMLNVVCTRRVLSRFRREGARACLLSSAERWR